MTEQEHSGIGSPVRLPDYSSSLLSQLHILLRIETCSSPATANPSKERHLSRQIPSVKVC